MDARRSCSGAYRFDSHSHPRLHAFALCDAICTSRVQYYICFASALCIIGETELLACTTLPSLPHSDPACCVCYSNLLPTPNRPTLFTSISHRLVAGLTSGTLHQRIAVRFTRSSTTNSKRLAKSMSQYVILLSLPPVIHVVLWRFFDIWASHQMVMQ
jgi:hypothetical protein